MSTIKVELQPFTTPNFVLAKMQPRPRQDGPPVESPKWALSELEPSVLAEMCTAFRQEVFRKAGKLDPAHNE